MQVNFIDAQLLEKLYDTVVAQPSCIMHTKYLYLNLANLRQCQKFGGDINDDAVKACIKESIGLLELSADIPVDLLQDLNTMLQNISAKIN